MGTVRLWLQVVRDNRPGWAGNNGTLWTRTYDCDFPPGPDDRIVLWPGGDDDPNVGPLWTVQGRWWDHAGQLHLEMSIIHVDPSDEIRAHTMRELARGGPPHRRSWDSQTDGNPEPALTHGGWEQYGSSQ